MVSKLALELQMLTRALEKPNKDRVLVNYGTYPVTRGEAKALAKKSGGEFIRMLWDDTVKENKVEIKTKMDPAQVEKLDENIRDVTYAQDIKETFS